MAVSALFNPEESQWVRPFEVSGWARFFAALGGPLPVPSDSDGAWTRFLGLSAVAPSILLLVGMAVSAAVPLVLCCGLPSSTKTSGGKAPWFLFVLACGLTAAVFVAGAALCADEALRGFALVTSEMNRAISDVSTVSQLAEAMAAAGHALQNELDQLNAACPQAVQRLVSGSVLEMRGEVGRFTQAVSNFSNSIHGVEVQLSSTEKISDTVAGMLAWCLALPTVAVLLSAVAVAASVVASEYSGTKCARRCRRCQLPCVSLFCIAPAMLLVTLVSGIELSVGILSGAVCADVDRTTVRFAKAKFGDPSPALNLTRYYVEGVGANPAVVYLHQAKRRIATTEFWVSSYEPILARSCINWNPTNLSLNLKAVDASIAESALLLKPRHIYPYYHSVAHELACGSAVSGLGWLVVLQVALGLVCMPALICTASCLVEALSAERRSGYAFDLLGQEDGDLTEA